VPSDELPVLDDTGLLSLSWDDSDTPEVDNFITSEDAVKFPSLLNESPPVPGIFRIWAVFPDIADVPTGGPVRGDEISIIDVLSFDCIICGCEFTMW
jgi:hypothetical protein